MCIIENIKIIKLVRKYLASYPDLTLFDVPSLGRGRSGIEIIYFLVQVVFSSIVTKIHLVNLFSLFSFIFTSKNR